MHKCIYSLDRVSLSTPFVAAGLRRLHASSNKLSVWEDTVLTDERQILFVGEVVEMPKAC